MLKKRRENRERSTVMIRVQTGSFLTQRVSGSSLTQCISRRGSRSRARQRSQPPCSLSSRCTVFALTRVCSQSGAPPFRARWFQAVRVRPFQGAPRYGSKPVSSARGSNKSFKGNDGAKTPFQARGVQKAFRALVPPVKQSRVVGAIHTQPGEPLPSFVHRPGVHHTTLRHEAHVVEERDDAAPRQGTDDADTQLINK